MGRIKDLKFYVEFMAFSNCKNCRVWKRTQPWGFEEHGKWKVLDLCKGCIWERRIDVHNTADLRYKLSEQIFKKWKIEAGIPKMFTTSELVYLAKMKEERKLDAIMKEIPSDGLEEWRKKHERR